MAFWNWILAHSAMLSAMVVAVIDLVWALSPGLKSNGILHAIYDFVKNKVAGEPPANG